MPDNKEQGTGFDSRRLHQDIEGLASLNEARGQDVAKTAECRKCSTPLIFSARARGNGLCGPCTRAECSHPDVERGDEFNPDRCRACYAPVFPTPAAAPRPPRLTDVEVQALATKVVSAPPEAVPKAIAMLADKTLELLARVPHRELAPQPPPANPPRGAAVWPLVIAKAERRGVDDRVIALMRARDEQGRAKYGVHLCANDGRDTGMDAIQEALDLIVYLEKKRMEGGIVRSEWTHTLTSMVTSLLNSGAASPEATKPCEVCGHTEGQEAPPVDGPTIDAFCPTCGWMGEVAR